MAKRDFYEVLGLQKGADEKALKAAYRTHAKKFHPDANPGDKAAEAKFKEISEAYDILKDPQKKAAYDRFGHQAFENGSGGGHRPGGAGFGPEFNSSMSDIFEDLFGDFMGGGGQRTSQRGRGGGGAARGADLRYNMEISLTEAYSGKTAQIRVPTSVSCDTCKGSGAKPGTSAENLHHLQRGGCGAVAIRLLHGGARLPHLPGPWPGDLRSVQRLRRPGPRHQGTQSLRQHSARGGRRDPHQARQ